MNYEDAYSKARDEAARIIVGACEEIGAKATMDDVYFRLEDPPENFGDISCSIAFGLARQLKKAPRQIAEELSEAAEKTELFDSIEPAAAGYVNFYLNLQEYSKLVLEAVDKSGEEYGSNNCGEGKKALVEFPSVNPNKPWHIGHMRNAILGDSLARVLEFSGYKVERMDYIDDLGLQVAQSVWGYLNLDNKIEGKPDHWLGKQYVEVAKKIEEPDVKKQVNEIIKQLEEGDNEIAKTGRELALKCVLAQYETAYRLGIFHHVQIWESDIVKSQMLEKALEKATESGGIVKEESGENAGCVVAKLGELEEFKGMENPDKVLVRSDGTAVYTGKDLAFQMWKFGLIESKFKFEKIADEPNGWELFASGEKGEPMGFGSADLVVNVIGVEQRYPQKVLRALLELMGYEKEAGNSVHLSYEHAALPEGKFSGRAGTWIGYTADKVIEDTVGEALKQIKERFADMSDSEKEEIAEMVGTGAIRFDFVRASPDKKIIFRWEDALRFEGDTAPYIQYSHARASRILEKAGELSGNIDYSVFASEHEKDLVKKLALFPEMVRRSARDHKPYYLAEYLLELSNSFSRFYTNCPVLKAEGNEKRARLELVKDYKQVVRNGLLLLGVNAPERM